MLLNSRKRPPYWNSTSGFDFDYIAVDMPFCTIVRNFIQIRPPSPEKNDVISIFKGRISAIVDFRSPEMIFQKPMYDFLSVVKIESRDHSSKLLIVFFRKSRFFAFWRHDRQSEASCGCVLAYHCVNCTAPANLSDSLRSTSEIVARRCLRSVDTTTLQVPSSRRAPQLQP